jgi:hypothetical protein
MLEVLNTTLASAQQYEPEAIASFQADNRVGEIGEPISQEMIHALLDLCMKGYADKSTELAEFWGNVRPLAPNPPLQL